MLLDDPIEEVRGLITANEAEVDMSITPTPTVSAPVGYIQPYPAIGVPARSVTPTTISASAARCNGDR
ncbi:MAG: hypothetical protein R2705_21880 [Ilumatobacteraceae bacterium]